MKQKRTAAKENKQRGGRRYVARPCSICGGEAATVIQPRVYRLGPGTGAGGKTPRLMKFGRLVLLCAKCSRSSSAYVEALGESARDLLAITTATATATPVGPGLFPQAETNIL